jgi:nicotinamide phosphoribosyltransferase
MTTWDNEVDAYRNMLEQFKGSPIISVVSDSYDIFNAVENIWGDELKAEVINSGSTLVIRPDSGDPTEVVTKIACLLNIAFGSTLNKKGYKELNHVKILQGDGITEKSIESILKRLESVGFSADNVVFGQGGGLLQQLDRDTCKFAMKASAAQIDGKWVDVFKDPVTDSGKRSKKGRVSLYQDADGNYRTATKVPDIGFKDIMYDVFENGRILKTWSFEEVRGQVENTTV